MLRDGRMHPVVRTGASRAQPEFNARTQGHKPARPAYGRLTDQGTPCVAEKVGAVLGNTM